MAFQTAPALQTYLVSRVLNRTTIAAQPPLFSKTVQDAALVTWDYSAALASGATISGTPTVSVSGSTATFGAVSKNTANTQTQALLSGGTAGDSAECICLAVDTEGQTITAACLVGIVANT